MSDPQEAATPPDHHSAEAPVWRDAWRTFQDPYLYPDAEKFPSPFESFVAGYIAAVRSRDAEVAELKAKIAELHPVEVWSRSWIAPHRPVGCPTCRTDGPCPTRQAVRGSASSPVEGGN